MGKPTGDRRAVILNELTGIRADLAEVDEAKDRAFARRLSLFQEARALDPPIMHRELAAAAGVTDAAVIQQLRAAES